MMSFDSLFGFILVVEENMQVHILMISLHLQLSSILSKPSKHISIVINSDFAVFRG